jgi:CHAT domain-containing protein
MRHRLRSLSRIPVAFCLALLSSLALPDRGLAQEIPVLGSVAEYRKLSDDELLSLVFSFKPQYDSTPAAAIPAYEEWFRRSTAKLEASLANNRKAKSLGRQLRQQGIQITDLEASMSTYYQNSAAGLYPAYVRTGNSDKAEKLKSEYFAMIDEVFPTKASREIERGAFYIRAFFPAQGIQHLKAALPLIQDADDRSRCVNRMLNGMFFQGMVGEDTLRQIQELLAPSMKLDRGTRSSALMSLAAAYSQLGRHEEALVAIKDSMALAEDNYGGYQEWTVAEWAWRAGHWEEGRDLAVKSLGHLKAKEDRPEAAGRRFALAKTAASFGENEEGVQFYEQGMDLLNRLDSDTDEILRKNLNLQAFDAAIPLFSTEKAVEWLDQIAPTDDRVSILTSLFVRRAAGDDAAVGKLIDETFTRMRGPHRSLLRTMSEGEREEDYFRTTFESAILNYGTEAQAVEATLMTKGLSSDLKAALLADRAAGTFDQQDADWLTSWLTRRTRHQQLSLAAPGTLSAKAAAELEEIARELDGMEAAAGGSARQDNALETLSWNLEQWVAQLPVGSVGVNFILYQKVETAPADLARRYALHTEPWYGAAVFGTGLAPRFLPLAPASKMDALIGRFRELIQSDEAVDADLESVCRDLYATVAAPLEALISPDHRVIYHPAGSLHLLPFGACLAPDASPWSARRQLTRITSFRALEQEGSTLADQLAASEVLLVGGVDYAAAGQTEPAAGTSAQRAGAVRAALVGGLESIPEQASFPALPGARREVELLETLLSGKVGRTTRLTAEAATEAAVVGSSAQIVHLATHGFFFDMSKATGAGMGQGAHVDPMTQSGLALSGAQHTLDAWRTGQIPPIDADGILLASELAGLDLSRVELLVLSACETGVGALTAGETVAGFAKACSQAGVKRTVLSLWPIADDATVDIMTRFFEGMLAGEEPESALNRAQLDAFTAAREKSGLKTAIQEALPFVFIDTRSTRH